MLMIQSNNMQLYATYQEPLKLTHFQGGIKKERVEEF